MATRPLGKGTRNITINVPVETFIEYERLVSLSGASKSDYGNALVDFAIRHNLVARKNTQEYERWISAIREGNSSVPKIGLEITDDQVREALEESDQRGSRIKIERRR